MRLDKTQALLLGLAAPALAAPSSSLKKRGAPDAEKANAVKDVFRTTWKGYYENAFPNDNLHPVSNGFDNGRNGWGVTAIDSLTTAIIMRDTESVKQILEFVPTIDFTTTAVEDENISVFESNIRYLGGLVSAYDLLKGPYSDLVDAPELVDACLEQAKSLADSLSIAFNTPSGVPDPIVVLNPEPRINGSTENNIAEAGTLVLEWTRLSDQLGDPKYGTLAQKAQAYMVDPTGEPEAFPGLIGTYLSTEDGAFLDSDGGWSGLTDSFYEYLIKMYLYAPAEFEHYKERWVMAADSTMKYLVSHPTTREDLTFLAQYSGQQIIPYSSHLASFSGGNFIFAGVLLGEQKYIDFGLQLTDSYFEPYRQTPVGIGPEAFRWVDSALPVDEEYNVAPPGDEEEFYSESGFWSISGGYILRPETMESVYFSYRATGDKKFQDMAWQAFNSITTATRAGSAYAELKDVMEADGGGHTDMMESFWLAETLKYIYLTFAEESPVQFKTDGTNEWVYNTEAHPVKIRG